MNHVVLITSFVSEKETKWKPAFAPSLATTSNAIWAFLHCSRFPIYINDVLHDMLGQFVIDNILKYFPSTQSHVSHVKQVLACTLPNHLYLKREKCKLYMFTVLIPCDFLTHQGNSQWYVSDQEPYTVKQLQRVLVWLITNHEFCSIAA